MIVPSGNGKLPFPVGFDRYIVAEKGAKIVEVAFFVGHGDQLPVAVSGRNCDSENRISLSVGASRGVSHVDDHASQRSDCKQQVSNPFHTMCSFPKCLFSDAFL